MSVQHLDVLWQHRAACRGPNRRIFFPPPQPEPPSDRDRREQQAKEICATCPVLVECRTYALTRQEQHGIWGGLTARERRKTGDS
jgi:WhiB family transcriptional regulator, redox-sensing transcriptional regulator